MHPLVFKLTCPYHSLIPALVSEAGQPGPPGAVDDAGHGGDGLGPARSTEGSAGADLHLPGTARRGFMRKKMSCAIFYFRFLDESEFLAFADRRQCAFGIT